MPMPFGNVLAHAGSGRVPAGAGHFVFVAVVAELHHVVDPHAFVAVVVVVRLPERAEGIDRDHPVVAKIPAQRFEFAAVQVAAKDHAFLVRLAVGDDLVAGRVDDRLAVLVLDLPAALPKLKYSLPSGPKIKA